MASATATADVVPASTSSSSSSSSSSLCNGNADQSNTAVQQLRVAMTGNVDAGKSTLVSEAGDEWSL